jgi:hypothetical protein
MTEHLQTRSSVYNEPLGNIKLHGISVLESQQCSLMGIVANPTLKTAVGIFSKIMITVFWNVMQHSAVGIY